ncbi:hypothetical protein N7510_005228 [Penicillium lagena]|uniref:uncharacterized protein n=1 Tax=Penicillium lagena TaxID=94218 RepID=UPI002541528E|nr:uncharacterized protein N7510_005228 [Penicillium lagena]KAJ5612034.1 hypothetical protein N7510_005228 [Penicillium lagena]
MTSARGSVPRRQRTFHFVNAHPFSDTESFETRHFLRSHVGSWVWQQIKQKSTISETDEPRERSQCANLSTNNPDWTSVEDIGDVPGSSTTKGAQDSGGGVALITSENTLHGSDSHPSRSLYTPLCTIDHIGNATLDPFQTFSSDFDPMLVNWCNIYNLTVLWPGLIPSSPKGCKNSAISRWFQLSWHEPTLFTTFLFSAVFHYQQLRLRNESKHGNMHTPLERKVLERFEFESIKRVKQAIQDTTRAVSDAVILSVGCLANNRRDELLRDENTNSPFEPPLRNLQWLDIYGSLSPNDIHLSGLAQLVGLRGGLQNIDLSALAPILCCSDILASSKILSHPKFPFCPLQGDQNHTLQSQLGFGSADLENGFMQLCHIGFTAQLAEVLQAAKSYISIVKRYHEGCIVQPDLRQISDQRNLVQYHLLALPSAEHLGQSFAYCSSVYEIARLAGLILGVGVIFPLPAETSPFSSLIKLLQIELQRRSIFKSSWCTPDVVRVLIWALMLGGIAAKGYPERPCDLEGLVMDREVRALHGQFVTVNYSKKSVNGQVRCRAYKGTVSIMGSSSETEKLYDMSESSMDEIGDFSPAETTGLITVSAIRLKKYGQM